MAPKPPDDVVIELRLPVTSGLRKLGSIIAKQGTACVLYEFEYTDLSGIGSAIQTATTALASEKARQQETAARAKAEQRATATSGSAAPDSETPDADASADEMPDDSEETLSSNDTLNALAESAALKSGDAVAGTSLTNRQGQTSFL